MHVAHAVVAIEDGPVVVHLRPAALVAHRRLVHTVWRHGQLILWHSCTVHEAAQGQAGGWRVLNLDVPVGYRLAGGLEETAQKHHHCHAATLDAAPAVRTRRRDPAAHAPDSGLVAGMVRGVVDECVIDDAVEVLLNQRDLFAGAAAVSTTRRGCWVWEDTDRSTGQAGGRRGMPTLSRAPFRS